MRILIAGGTGFMGVPLVRSLLARGDTITLLTRNVEKAKGLFDGQVNLIGSLQGAVIDVDAVINLVGEPIIDKRWTDRRKQALRASRIETTNDIIQWISRAQRCPDVLINGSAIGYYGNYPETMLLNETAKPRACFSSDLCVDWEAAAREAQCLGVRVCLLRTGIVLAPHGGALKRMLLPFKFGLGGPIATGKQGFSWIHLDDMVNAIVYLLDHPSIKGPVNAVAPKPVSNGMFAKALASVLKRPAFLPMPSAVVKLLFGEASELLVEGQLVTPKKLLDHGFRFQHGELRHALNDLIYN